MTHEPFFRQLAWLDEVKLHGAQGVLTNLWETVGDNPTLRL
jgi:hypothetical protein